MEINWYKSLQSSDSDRNIEKANVLIRLDEQEQGLKIIIESIIKTHDSDHYWITEEIIPQSYEQGLDIISKFDTISACNFIDRSIEVDNIQF